MPKRPGDTALSVRQPWAWLLVNGYKDIEEPGIATIAALVWSMQARPSTRWATRWSGANISILKCLNLMNFGEGALLGG